MANKKLKRYTLNRDKLLQILKDKDLSIRKLEKDPNFPYTARSISRAFKEGATFNLMYNLSQYLDVSLPNLT